MYMKIPEPECCPQTNIKQICQVILQQLPFSLQYLILPAPLIRGLSTSELDLLSSKQANNTQQMLYIEVKQTFIQTNKFLHARRTNCVNYEFHWQLFVFSFLISVGNNCNNDRPRNIFKSCETTTEYTRY